MTVIIIDGNLFTTSNQQSGWPSISACSLATIDNPWGTPKMVLNYYIYLQWKTIYENRWCLQAKYVSVLHTRVSSLFPLQLDIVHCTYVFIYMYVFVSFLFIAGRARMRPFLIWGVSNCTWVSAEFMFSILRDWCECSFKNTCISKIKVIRT